MNVAGLKATNHQTVMQIIFRQFETFSPKNLRALKKKLECKKCLNIIIDLKVM